MQANEPEDILPLTEEMTRVAAGAGIEASLQASLRRGSALTLLGRLAEAEERLGPAGVAARRSSLPGNDLDIWAGAPPNEDLARPLIAATRVADRLERGGGSPRAIN